MFYANTRYQVGVYRTIGPLVLHLFNSCGLSKTCIYYSYFSLQRFALNLQYFCKIFDLR